jgi:hypothetical protein
MTEEMWPGYRKKSTSPSASASANAPTECTPGITIDGEPLPESVHVSNLIVALQQHIANQDDSMAVYPIQYHSPTNVIVRQFATTRAQARARSHAPPPSQPPELLNNDVSSCVRQLTRYQAVLYGFGGGHVAHTIKSLNLPIQIVASSDLDPSARSFMHEFMNIPRIFSTAKQLLTWITSDDTLYVDIYISHAPVIVDTSFVSCWWDFQAEIINNARTRKGLQTFMVFVPSLFVVDTVSPSFRDTLRLDGWVLNIIRVNFADFGDSIDDYSTVIFGAHSSTQSTTTPISILQPPKVKPQPISSFIHEKFNDATYAVSFARDSLDEYSDNDIVATDPQPSKLPSSRDYSLRLYDLLSSSKPSGLSLGAGVYDIDHLFPPLEQDNDNLFGRLFGIQFKHMNATLVRPISPYEYVRGFGYKDDIAQKLALPANYPLLTGSIPLHTSAACFDAITNRMREIRDNSIVVDESTPFIAPAATAQIVANGASGHTLPSPSRWIQEYDQDSETRLIMQMVRDPSLHTKENMNKLHFVYRRYLRHSMIIIDSDCMLRLNEPLAGSDDYTSLQIVPASLRNLIFVCFHANPIGGHFNAYRTFTRIRLRFFWPKMYSYITNLVSHCAGCRLSNPTLRKSAELVYNFPVDEPCLCMHLDCYQAGALKTYDNVSCYVVGACNMTGFGMLEGISEPNSTNFAKALMRFQLRYGFFHTIILDKDSKFYATFRETCQLLKIKTHTLSRANHDPMLVERLNRYFNKCLKVFVAEHNNDPGTTHEGLLMALFAWNCAPVPGTDISRCLQVTGREWHYPIDFSSDKHLELLSNTHSIRSFAQRQSVVLSATRAIARVNSSIVYAQTLLSSNQVIMFSRGVQCNPAPNATE